MALVVLAFFIALIAMLSEEDLPDVSNKVEYETPMLVAILLASAFVMLTNILFVALAALLAP